MNKIPTGKQHRAEQERGLAPFDVNKKAAVGSLVYLGLTLSYMFGCKAVVNLFYLETLSVDTQR